MITYGSVRHAKMVVDGAFCVFVIGGKGRMMGGAVSSAGVSKGAAPKRCHTVVCRRAARAVPFALVSAALQPTVSAHYR